MSPPVAITEAAAEPSSSVRHWYKDAVIYELHVRPSATATATASATSAGSSQKLDYLQDLGVTALWLLPFYPSPLRDDGYDISDYRTSTRRYGTLRRLPGVPPRGAPPGTAGDHRAGPQPHLRPASLVPARATAPPGIADRDFYVWSDTPERFRDARIIFKDFETSNWTWDPVAQAYYWHRFYSHQPDLNYDNPAVQRRPCSTSSTSGSTWASTGCGSTPSPTCSSARAPTARTCPRPTTFLRDLRAHVDARFATGMLLAEANQWPEDAVGLLRRRRRMPHGVSLPADAAACSWPLRQEDRFPIVDILAADAGHPAQLPVGACSCATTTS